MQMFKAFEAPDSSAVTPLVWAATNIQVETKWRLNPTTRLICPFSLPQALFGWFKALGLFGETGVEMKLSGSEDTSSCPIELFWLWLACKIRQENEIIIHGQRVSMSVNLWGGGGASALLSKITLIWLKRIAIFVLFKFLFLLIDGFVHSLSVNECVHAAYSQPNNIRVRVYVRPFCVELIDCLQFVRAVFRCSASSHGSKTRHPFSITFELLQKIGRNKTIKGLQYQGVQQLFWGIYELVLQLRSQERGRSKDFITKVVCFTDNVARLQMWLAVVVQQSHQLDWNKDDFTDQFTWHLPLVLCFTTYSETWSVACGFSPQLLQQLLCPSLFFFVIVFLSQRIQSLT